MDYLGKKPVNAAVDTGTGGAGVVRGIEKDPGREPHVRRALTHLEARLDDIGGSLRVLHEKLQPILRSASPAPTTASKEKPSTGVQLADALDDLCDRAHLLFKIVEDLTERIEV